MSSNRKTVLLVGSLAPEARELIDARGDVEPIYFPHMLPDAEFLELTKAHAPVSACVLGATRIGDSELEAAEQMQVVARVGVGFDAIDVPALTKRAIPLMVAGTANSPSVAEQALFMMMALSRRGAELDRLVRDGNWLDRFDVVPFDLFEKTALVVGFGRIGTRTAKRCAAMDMTVEVYDPYIDQTEITRAGFTPVDNLNDALPRADFVTIHCPKTPETIGMFDADRIGRMKPTAYLVNTARGGIIDEPALDAALSRKTIAGAGLDVFATEPASADNPLFKHENIITAPHMAGVTREAIRRMGVAAVRNIFSVFDGAPIMENVINPEIYS